MIWPVSVCPSSESIRLARPKSVILGTPSEVYKTLVGLRSRWMIPAWCATWMARARVTINSAAWLPGWGVPARRSSRLPPSSSSSDTNGRPSTSPMS